MSTYEERFRQARELETAGRESEAEQAYRQALAIDPSQVAAWLQLAMIYIHRHDGMHAVECSQAAVKLAPEQYNCWNMLGAAFRQARNFTAAEDAYRRALLLHPNDVRVQSNLSNVLIDAGKLSDAEPYLQGILCATPENPAALENLARLRRMQQRYSEVLPLYDALLRLKPKYAKGHLARAEFLLFCQDFHAGWEEYEWRWGVRRSLQTKRPRWEGEELPGKTILLWSEQGLGDTIQFVRYAQLVKPWVGRVLLQCPPRMIPLLSTVAGIDGFVPSNQPPPEFHVHAPLLSLPRIFLTNQFSIPASIPYITAEPARVAQWAQRLGPAEGKLRIGIAWQGSVTHVTDYLRSFSLEQFAPLAKLPNVELISLQGSKAGTIAPTFPLRQFADLDQAGSFLDSAALLQHIPLVVSCDTSIGHLAGALRVETFLALGVAEDWRWHRGLDTSPWYPRTRLFRQREVGNWDAVFQQISTAIQQKWKECAI